MVPSRSFTPPTLNWTVKEMVGGPGLLRMTRRIPLSRVTCCTGSSSPGVCWASSVCRELVRSARRMTMIVLNAVIYFSDGVGTMGNRMQSGC